MQNSGITTENGSSVPPPPPPLPSKNPLLIKCKCIHVKEVKFPKRSPQSDVISALRHVTHNFDVENAAKLISLYYPVCPIIQEGRCCGIVALSMASQLICHSSVEDVLSLAKSLNFTNEGEMFSAYNMATLATTLLNCDAVVLDNLNYHKEDLLNHICNGNPLLIPYDADKNHFPCTNQGLTAHWAVVTGLCFTISKKACIQDLLISDIINEFPELKIFNVKDGFSVKNFLQYSEKVFVYAHQGKSKHLAAWNLNDLLESNKNMYEVTKKYSLDQLVLPSIDSLSELRNKAVLLKKKNCH